MKVSDQERMALVRAVFPVVAGFKFTTAPPNREGKATKVSPDFAAACWTRRYVDTLVKILEKEDGGGRENGADVSSSGASASGFPS